MKLLLISDLHLVVKNPVARIDDLTTTQFEKIEFIFNLAKENNAIIIQAGDFFDKPRSWSLLSLIIDFLKKFDISVYCVMGQHDIYMYSELTKNRTNMGILNKTSLLNILNDKPAQVGEGADKVFLYGASYGENLPRIQRLGFTLGVIHASISDRALWPDHKFTSADKYLADNPEYDVILVGDVHSCFSVKDKQGRYLINTGPILRKEANEYNFTHMPKIALFDTETKDLEWIDIPASVPELILSRSHIEYKEENDQMLDEFVSQIKKNTSDSEDCSSGTYIENLWNFVKINNIDKAVVDILANITEKKIVAKEEL